MHCEQTELRTGSWATRKRGGKKFSPNTVVTWPSCGKQKYREKRILGKEGTTCNGLENKKVKHILSHENVEGEVSVERHEYI